jgi:hypothetical protein
LGSVSREVSSSIKWHGNTMTCAVVMVSFFGGYWGLNSSLHAGELLLEPLHQPCFVLSIFKVRVSQTICLANF